MRYVIIALLVLSLLVVGCSSAPAETQDDGLQLPPPPPPPPPIGDGGDVTGDAVAPIEEPVGDDLEQAMDDIDLDDW